MPLQPEIKSVGGLLFVSPPALTLPTAPTPTAAVTATASRPPAASASMHKPLVVLFDPTSGREQTAHRLAAVGGWRIMAVDTNDAAVTAPAIDGIVSAAQGGSPISYKPAAFVFEAVHPLRPFAPTQPSQQVSEDGGSSNDTDDSGNNDNTMSITSLLTSSNAEYERQGYVEPPKSAPALIKWLTRFHDFEGVPFVLYTADQDALVTARKDYEGSRADRYNPHRLHLFDGTLERNIATESDLALAQLLSWLIAVPPPTLLTPSTPPPSSSPSSSSQPPASALDRYRVDFPC
jgi:hypothetical protein